MALLQPSIHIANIRIDEPVTVVTDLLVSVVCFYAWWRLGKTTQENRVKTFLRYYFMSMGIATIFGGIIGHGFLYWFDEVSQISFVVSPWKLPGWLVSMFSITLVERASIEHTRPIIRPFLGKLFNWINIIELLVFIFIAIYTLNFFFVQVHAAYGLLFVVSTLNLYVYIKLKTKASKLFLGAVGVAAVSATIFLSEWGISVWFNHFDISHVLMAISAYLFYLAGMELVKDEEKGVIHNIQ